MKFQYCKQKGGAVVEINSEYENQLLNQNKGLLGIRLFWIGLSKHENEYQWDSGTKLTWNKFTDDLEDGQCAIANDDIIWDAKFCNSYANVLCETSIFTM